METTASGSESFVDAKGHPLLRFRLGGPDIGELVIGSNEWCAWEYPGLDIRVRLEEAGRFQVTALALMSNKQSLWGRAPITVTELRDIPLVRLDAAINDPRLEDALPAAIEYAVKKGQDLSPTGGIEREQITAGEAVPAPGKNYKLDGAKNTRGRPNAFYKGVAHAWAAAITEGHRNPATVIADANQVSVTAVHRWVREARRRGVMAPSNRDGESATENT